MFVGDNNAELTSHAKRHWLQERSIAQQDIGRGKSQLNMFVESANGRFRDDLPTQPLLDSLRATRRIIDARIAAAIDVFLIARDTARNRGR